jgi:hypothetical protein
MDCLAGYIWFQKPLPFLAMVLFFAARRAWPTQANGRLEWSTRQQDLKPVASMRFWLCGERASELYSSADFYRNESEKT